MQRTTIRRRVTALLLGMTILSPAAWGAERKSGSGVEKAKIASFALLQGLWDQLSALFGEEGAYIDPNGIRATGPNPPPPAPNSQEAGAYIDPDGAV